jgi:predicted nucleic acid-binding protein
MSAAIKVVFDCNGFLHALGDPDGPAGRCVQLAITGKVSLYISPQVLDEIRDVTSRPKLVQHPDFRVFTPPQFLVAVGTGA